MADNRLEALSLREVKKRQKVAKAISSWHGTGNGRIPRRGGSCRQSDGLFP